MYELYIEGYKVDIDQKISIALTYAIDDVANFSSRETGFSKAIVLPGTGRNNQIFGFIYDLGSYNYELPGAANIGSVFNVAQTSRAELRLNGLLVLRGVFRITNIVKDKDIIEYEGAIFGELSGFIANIGNGKLEYLNFSQYDHNYTRDEIVNSWNTINGSGYYYPLIDYGTYGYNNKKNFDYRTFRPAMYVKEYIDKIFEYGGYTYQSNFFDSAFFKSLIIPNNDKVLKRLDTRLLDASKIETTQNFQANGYIEHDEATAADFNVNGAKSEFTYFGATLIANLSASIRGNYTANTNVKISVTKNSIDIFSKTFPPGSRLLAADFNGKVLLQANDVIRVEVIKSTGTMDVNILLSEIAIWTDLPVYVTVDKDDAVKMNDAIPKGILQKDFFSWIVKMFNLYIVEDKLRENHLIIEPYIDFYGTDTIDWTYKVARDKPWQIKPMGQLNGRFFEYKFKEDNDFYNEGYKKKYNESYGNRLEDTGFQFAKDKQTLEIGFSPSVMVQYVNTDKIMPAIYKKSKGNAVDQEELTESNIRILIAKKITGVTAWYINDTAFSQLGAALTSYGYAGHFDDPLNPTKDINFGAAQEIYFDPVSYTSNNLFNDYWSEYISEIADKDSKILVCYAYLTSLDIAQLDFSKAVLIDGIRFRINKIEDYDYTNNELVKVELLKIIDNG